MRKISLFVCLLLCLCQCKQPEKVLDGHVELEVKLTGKKYTQLVLVTLYRIPEGWDMEGYDVFKEFLGYSKDGYNWKFIVPDSINEIAEGYNIRIYPYDFEKNQGGEIMFTLKELPESKRVRCILLEGEKTIIEGVYRGEIIKNFTGFGYAIIDSYVESPTLIFDLFDIQLKNKKNKKCSELELNFYYPDFSILPEADYEEALQQRIALVKEYPNSNYLLHQLGASEGYKSKGDMRIVFDNFSEKMKSSYLGQHIEEYLSRKIIPVDIFTENLTNSKSHQLEPVITNKSKPTLILFSASWCGPCHKLIPQLKEIYNELSSSIDMVYISMDRDQNVQSWKELMTNEQIPWRSLLAEDKIEGFYEKYSIRGIPYAMLVHNNVITPVNPRDKESLREIISTITKE